MDGGAIAFGLSSSVGAEWLKEVVPKVGLRLKVHAALHSLYQVKCLTNNSCCFLGSQIQLSTWQQ